MANSKLAKASTEKKVTFDGDQIIYNTEILSPEFEKSGYNSVWTDKVDASEVNTIGGDYWEMYDYSDARVVSADYLKLQSLSLTYELPEMVFSRLGLQRLAFTLSAYNLFTICDSALKGQTPTQGGFTNIQLSERPSFSFGMNIQF